jgi:hypothetical protein
MLFLMFPLRIAFCARSIELPASEYRRGVDAVSACAAAQAPIAIEKAGFAEEAGLLRPSDAAARGHDVRR